MVLNYNNDDPWGLRYKRRFALYRKAVTQYDLLVVVREPNVQEATAAGARHPLLVARSADEVSHASLPLTSADQSRWGSEVAFVGTWMPERGSFLVRLIELGVPLKIYGDRWHKAREWPTFAARQGSAKREAGSPR